MEFSKARAFSWPVTNTWQETLSFHFLRRLPYMHENNWWNCQSYHTLHSKLKNDLSDQIVKINYKCKQIYIYIGDHIWGWDRIVIEKDLPRKLFTRLRPRGWSCFISTIALCVWIWSASVILLEDSKPILTMR